MALFVKKREDGGAGSLYTTAHRKTILIVGLGNIGKEYDGTRHNVGFASIDSYHASQGFPAWTVKKDLRAMISSQSIGDTQVILAKPTTYMNESGQAVSAVQNYFKVSNNATVVVHDDLDVNFGQIRLRKGGGSAGNNGIKSLISHIDEDFQRVRVGIKNELVEKMDSANFVLAKFSKTEKESLQKIQNEISSILSEFAVTAKLPQETRKIIN